VERTVKKALLNVLRPGRSVRALASSGRSSALLRVGLLFASLLAASPARAGAATRLVYVRSRATSGCPEQSVLEAAVTARLGYEAFSAWGDQTIIATISRSKAGLVARAELIDHDGIAQGSREVEASVSDCDELIATLALAISITLDPMHVTPSPSPAPQTSEQTADDVTEPAARAPEAPATPEPERPDPAQPKPTQTEGVTRPARASAWALHAYGGGFGAIALLPHATLGARVAAGLRQGRFSLWLGGESTLPSANAATESSNVRVSLLSSEFTLCRDMQRSLAVCSLISFGRLRGEGQGVAAPRSESVFYASLGARTILTLPLGQGFALLGAADVSAVLTRPTFQLMNVDVWRPSALAIGAGLGVSARFL
jgi:hypothetical protein